MEITGRVIKVLPERSGVSQRTGNPWKSLPFVVAYYENPSDRLEDRVLLETFDEKAMDIVKICAAHSGEAGYDVKCVIGHSTREWDGKVFNEIRTYSVTAAGSIPTQETQTAANAAGTVANGNQVLTDDQKKAIEALNQMGGNGGSNDMSF